MNILKNKLSIGLLIMVLGINLASASEKNKEGEERVKDIVVKTTQQLTAKAVVLTFQDTLINVMKNGDTLGFQGRYDQLKTAIIDSHDLTKIARIVVGKERRKMSNEQKKTLIDIFKKLSVSAYAYNFKGFSGEAFNFLSESKTARGGIVVRTLFVLPNDKDVKFDYMLKKRGDDWRIINIIASGVSDLALKRSEYASVLKREGFDALIAKINEKIDNYAKQ